MEEGKEWAYSIEFQTMDGLVPRYSSVIKDTAEYNCQDPNSGTVGSTETTEFRWEG